MRKVSAVILTAALCSSVWAGVATGAEPKPGENGYVSLHTYLSRTDDPAVVKVTHTVQAKIDIPRKKVVFVLDDSGSMLYDGSGFGSSAGALGQFHMYQEVMAPFGPDVFDHAGMDATHSMNLGVGGRSAAILHNTDFYWKEADGSIKDGKYLDRWTSMVSKAVPAALEAMWGSSPSVSEKIEVAVLTFGSNGSNGLSGRVIKTTGGFVDYHGSNGINPVGSTWGGASGAGSGYANLNTWIQSASCANSGTYMDRGLEEAYELLSSAAVQPGDELYVLTLTDGQNGSGGDGLARDWAAALKGTAGTTVSNGTVGSLTGLGAEIWAVTLNNSNPIIHAFMDDVASSPALSFKPYTQEAAANVFTAFGDKVKGANGVEARIDVNASAFDIISYQGRPLYELAQSDGEMDMVASLHGCRLDWRFDASLKDGVLYTLSYYVRSKANVPGISQAVLQGSVLRYSYADGAGVTHTVAKSFPTAFVGEQSQTDENAAIVKGQGQADENGSTGMEGHQQNRRKAKNPVAKMATRLEMHPVIRGVRNSLAPNGRAIAIVDVDNGAFMRYQWQMRTEEGEWQDIFGATASQYTLGAQFQEGQRYQLRCRIISPTGNETTSDVLVLEATVKGQTKGLQSK